MKKGPKNICFPASESGEYSGYIEAADKAEKQKLCFVLKKGFALPIIKAAVFLVAAALLEAGGDAVIRTGLGQSATGARIAWLGAGAVTLTTYGMLVNQPGWDFGRLLGAYVAVFFVTAQVINVVAFHRPLALPVLVGGALITAGGFVVALWPAS